MKTFRALLLFTVVAFLASCGGRMSGTYVNSNVIGGKITFLTASKAQVEIMGSITECKYEKDGNQVKLTNGDKNEILTIDKDGCLDGGVMGKYCKQ